MDEIEKLLNEKITTYDFDASYVIIHKGDLKRLIELVENEQMNIADNGMIPGYINYHSDLTDQLSKIRRVSEQIDWEEL